MIKLLEHAVSAFPSNLDVRDCFLRAVQKRYAHSVSACNGRCTAVGKPENAMKRRKALLSEEELLVRDKVRKVSRKASETCEQTLHKQEQNQTHMISINTYHLACAKGSAFQCRSLVCSSKRNPTLPLSLQLVCHQGSLVLGNHSVNTNNCFEACCKICMLGMQ